MLQARFSVPSCIERERLEFELPEVRARGQYLARLRSLSREEQAASERLVDHGLAHGCSG